MSLSSDMLENWMEIYVDHFLVSRNTFDQCLKTLGNVFKRCESTNLVLNWQKYYFMVTEWIVLGYRVSSKDLEVDQEKVKLIEKFSPPTNVKRVRSLLYHDGFYRMFIKDFSKITKLLCNLLGKDVAFNFDESYLEAYNRLQEKLNSAPIIDSPVLPQPFELICDSDYANGAIFRPAHQQGLPTIYYANRTLNENQLNYATM